VVTSYLRTDGVRGLERGCILAVFSKYLPMARAIFASIQSGIFSSTIVAVDTRVVDSPGIYFGQTFRLFSLENCLLFEFGFWFASGSL
jgi:hypothetical protein